MQDKVDTDIIEQSFVDTSWKSLNARLDREMPIYRDSSQLAAKLLGLALFFCIIVLAFLSYLYIVRIPVASATKYTIHNQTQYVPYQNSLLSLNDGNGDIASTGVSKTDKKLVFSSIVRNPLLIHDNFESTKNSHFDAGVSNQTTDALQSIDLITRSIDMASERSFAKPQLANNTQLKKAKHNLGFYFSFSSFLSNLNYTGHGLGFGLEIPIKGALAFETGVHLNYFSKDYFILPFLERSGPNSFKSLVSPNLRDADTYYSGLNGFKQFVLPAGLIYSFNNRLSMNSGVRFRYTYAETIEEGLKAKARKKIARNQSVAETFFNNSNLGIYTGISYEFTDHFSLRVDAELGLSSLVSNKAISDPYFRNFDLNIVNLSSYFKF